MRPSRPTAIRSKKNSCGDRHARRREAERRSRQSSLVLVDDRQPPMTRSGRLATLEEAKAHFQKSWDAWKAWAKLEEVPCVR